MPRWIIFAEKIIELLIKQVPKHVWFESTLEPEQNIKRHTIHMWHVINIIINLHTYSMVHTPPWEANWFAASQEIPRISQNPKVHYRTHKCPPPVSILGQSNPIHIPTSHLLEIHPNIIHPSTPRSPQWSPSLRFPHQDPIHPPLLTHTRPNVTIVTKIMAI